MARGKMILVALVVFFIVAAGTGRPVFGQEKDLPAGPAESITGFDVGRMLVCAGVEDREPVGVSESFQPGTGTVYAFLEAVDITRDTTVTFAWYHAGEEINKFTLPIKKGPRWRTYAGKNLYDLKGSWKVDLLDSAGKTVFSVDFTVQ